MTTRDLETLYLIFLLGLILIAISTALLDWIKRTNSKKLSEGKNSRAVVQRTEIEPMSPVELKSSEDEIISDITIAATLKTKLLERENNIILESHCASPSSSTEIINHGDETNLLNDFELCGTEPIPNLDIFESSLIKVEPQTDTAKDYEGLSEAETILINEDFRDEGKRLPFEPVHNFDQNTPIAFPYVCMPDKSAIIKMPKKGAHGRRGHKEEDFLMHLKRYFSENISIVKDRVLSSPRNNYFPDFCIVYDPAGKRILFDIEIDEPYEGINEISVRRTTHFINDDNNRNNYFTKHGWIVIRFAEIQIHQSPNSCCRFIADVIKSVVPNYHFPESLACAPPLKRIKQWSREEAEAMSKDKYREGYLGITNFGKTEKMVSLFQEDGSDLDEVIVSNKEEVQCGSGEVKDEQEEGVLNYEPEIMPKDDAIENTEQPLVTKVVTPPAGNNYSVIRWALQNNMYLSFTFNQNKIIEVNEFKPHYMSSSVLTGYVGNHCIQYYMPYIDNIIVHRAL